MEIRLLRDGDEAACNDFHNRLYGKNRTVDQWRWEFAENTFGGKPLPFACAVDNGRIVGTQAFIPIQMIDRQGVFWTAKSEETLVDPEYRGQHLFEKMYDLLFDYASRNEFAFIWGFTPAEKAFRKLNFDIPGYTNQLFLPFSTRSVTPLFGKLAKGKSSGRSARLKDTMYRAAVGSARLYSATRLALSSRALARGVTLSTMEQPDGQLGACCDRFVAQWGGTTIYRDQQYLKWRLYDNPHVKSIVSAVYSGSELLGWVAFTLGDDGLGYLVDIVVACDEAIYKPGTLVRRLLLDATIRLRNMGASGIRGWSVSNHPFDRLVRRTAREIGFLHLKKGNSVVLYRCTAGEQRSETKNFDDWYITRIFTEGTLS